MLFDACDIDQSAFIEEDEFDLIMVVLSSQLTWRIATYYAVMITLVPYMIMWSLQFLNWFGVDETFTRMDTFLSAYAPFPFSIIVDLVPDSTWVKLPEILLSFGVFSFTMPYFWFVMDNYLEGVAIEKNSTSTSESQCPKTAKVD